MPAHPITAGLAKFIFAGVIRKKLVSSFFKPKIKHEPLQPPTPQK